MFFDTRVRSLMSRTAITLKFKMSNLLENGHPKTQTMQTADCRVQTVQTMQAEYFFSYIFRHYWQNINQFIQMFVISVH